MGTVIESQAYDIYRFAGGSVLYQAGYSGVMLILQVVLADFSNLNWRLLCSLIPAMPFIINTWISGNVTESSFRELFMELLYWYVGIHFPIGLYSIHWLFNCYASEGS